MDIPPGMDINTDNCVFIEEIINGMLDWVRVLDRNNRVLFMNRSMAEALGKNAVGMKCYEAIGRKEPCENCIFHPTIFEGKTSEKEEHINGKVFSVMSSPIKDQNEKIVAVVEVFRDVTVMRKMQDSIIRQNESIRNDIGMARKIQYSMLPREMENEKLCFSYVYQPCEDIGGDYLDFFKIDESHAGLLISDVQGHGIPASLLTVFVMSALDRQTLSPSLALEKLHADFNKNNFDSNLYITVFYSVIDLEKLTITYANAGHSGSPVIFGNNRFDILRSPGTPISDWTDTPGYENKVAPLYRGNRIFFYTDGIMELRNRKSGQYGEDRLLDILLGGGTDSKKLLESIISDAKRFVGRDIMTWCDDITMAILDVK